MLWYATKFDGTTQTSGQGEPVLDKSTFVAKLREAHAHESVSCDFRTTDRHVDEAWQRAKQVGFREFIGAYGLWLQSENEDLFQIKTTQTQENPFTHETMPVYEDRAWPLHTFLSWGFVDEYIKKVGITDEARLGAELHPISLSADAL